MNLKVAVGGHARELHNRGHDPLLEHIKFQLH
jgi:hypothetical protein